MTNPPAFVASRYLWQFGCCEHFIIAVYSYPAWGYFTHQCISYGRTAKTTKLLNNSVTGRNFKKIFLQWLLRHAIITLFEKNLRNYGVNMIKKKIKSKFRIFDQKNSDNSKTPLSISVFFCVYITSHETNTWVKKFWKKNTIFFFLYF